MRLLFLLETIGVFELLGVIRFRTGHSLLLSGELLRMFGATPALPGTCLSFSGELLRIFRAPPPLVGVCLRGELLRKLGAPLALFGVGQRPVPFLTGEGVGFLFMVGLDDGIPLSRRCRPVPVEEFRSGEGDAFILEFFEALKGLSGPVWIIIGLPLFKC